ncbi:MAG: T9SS type A sorting domain-containing protein [Saprospiraceae bacterium]|nr:T9SS type A sorting domain-containing protein [Saprospiraceae bacterium]
MIRSFLFCLLNILVVQVSLAQQDTLICEPDSAFIASGAIVFPPPLVNDTLGIGIPVNACISTPYDLTFFLNSPSNVTIAGTAVEVNWIRVDSVANLPKGITFDCSVSDCMVFPDSIACIRLSGTPEVINEPGDYELVIFMTASTNIIPMLPIMFPSEALGAPGSYTLTLDAEGACDSITAAKDFTEPEALSIFPNPVDHSLNVHWNSKENGEGSIQLLSLTGQVLREEKFQTQPGRVEHKLNVGGMADGLYLLQFTSKQTNFRRKILKL